MRVADPIVPDDTVGRSACVEQGSFSSVIATLSWSGAPERFRRDSGRISEGTEFRTMRVFEISADPRMGSHIVYDYVFSRPAGNSSWTPVGRDVVYTAG